MNTQILETTEQLQFMAELVNSHTAVAGDIVQLGVTTWGIHGSIPVDGEVLLAEYSSYEEASAALAVLAPNFVFAAATEASPPFARRCEPLAGAPAYFRGRDAATWRAALGNNNAR